MLKEVLYEILSHETNPNKIVDILRKLVDFPVESVETERRYRKSKHNGSEKEYVTIKTIRYIVTFNRKHIKKLGDYYVVPELAFIPKEYWGKEVAHPKISFYIIESKELRIKPTDITNLLANAE